MNPRLPDSLLSGIETIIGADELAQRFAEAKRPLRVKFGVDPTRPDLTFGHMVVFNKLRQFQDLGHEAILIIGDFTTLIGDPSGRSDLRPVLTREEINHNAETYLEQAFRVIDRDKTTVRRNSEWFDAMSFEDCLKLAREITVARMLERDDFQKRYQGNTPISLIEFLYPLVQGHDSVRIEADVELGGSDQLFNMLVGRQLQKSAGQPEQAIITMPLLVGLDGSKKMSKSADNYIAFNDSAKEMFGKLMSLPDAPMWDYYRLLLLDPEEALASLKLGHPMEAKKQLASRLTARFHGEEAAVHELEQFEQVFSKKELPDEMPDFSFAQLSGGAAEVSLLDAIAATDLFKSKKEIRRLIEQGAVKLDGERVDDPFRMLIKPDNKYVIQAGKRTFFTCSGQHPSSIQNEDELPSL